MYTLKAPILGFYGFETIEIEKQDDVFSKIVFHDSNMLSTCIVNSKHLQNVSFDLEQEIKESLEIQEGTSYEIYFPMVIQTPIEKSIVNLGAPIIINEDSKAVGQYVINNKSFRHAELRKICA